MLCLDEVKKCGTCIDNEFVECVIDVLLRMHGCTLNASDTCITIVICGQNNKCRGIFIDNYLNSERLIVSTKLRAMFHNNPNF